MKTELPDGELEKITFCWISQLDMKMRNLFAVVLKLKQRFFDVGHWCCCERLQNLSVNWVCCVYKHLPDLILNGWSKMDFWSPVKWGKMSETTETGRGKSIALQSWDFCSQVKNIYLHVLLCFLLMGRFPCKENL